RTSTGGRTTAIRRTRTDIGPPLRPRPLLPAPGHRRALLAGRLSPLLSRRESLLFQRRHLVCAPRARICRGHSAAGSGDLGITAVLLHGLDRRRSLLLCRQCVLHVAARSERLCRG